MNALLLAALTVHFASAKEVKPAGHATVSGVVELPLYSASSAGDFGWYVEGKIGDKPVLLQIATEDSGLTLHKGSLGRLGLKSRGKDDKAKAKVPALSFGDISISGLDAAVVGGTILGVDGRIGIASVPELAWAVLPSTGKVRIGPAGPSSVASDLGADLPYASVAGRKHQVGTDRRQLGDSMMLVKASFSGVQMETALATGNLRARVLREVDGGADWFTVGGVPNPTNPLPAVEGLDRGEVEMEWREVGLGQASHWARVDRTGGGLLYRFLAAARIGFDVVQHYDLGVDPSRHTIALRPNAGSAAVSYAPVLEARLKADYEAPADEGSDLEAARAALAGKAAPLADFYAQTGNTAQSLAMARIVADNAPNTCDSWQALGQAQLAAADAAGSVASLRKAGEMYASWAARPLAERSRLQESEAKRSKKADFDGVWAQPSSCHTAWADLAVALVVAGQPEAVAEIFPARVDLDSGLPLAAGNAHLLRGDMAAAEAAYRQAVKLSYNSEDAAREGLLLAVGGRSIDLAKAQFVSNPDTSIAGFPYYQAYARVVRTAEGADAAIAALQAFLARAPWSLGGWLALAEEQAMAGRDATAALKVATELVAAQLPWDTGNARLHAENAELLRLQGKLAEAAAEAEKAQSLDPTNALGWYVRARVAEAAGDAARAAELRKRAGQIGAADPMYSSLLSGS